MKVSQLIPQKTSSLQSYNEYLFVCQGHDTWAPVRNPSGFEDWELGLCSCLYPSYLRRWSAQVSVLFLEKGLIPTQAVLIRLQRIQWGAPLKVSKQVLRPKSPCWFCVDSLKETQPFLAVGACRTRDELGWTIHGSTYTPDNATINKLLINHASQPKAPTRRNSSISLSL